MKIKASSLRYETIPIADLSSELYAKLSHLNFRSDGVGMQTDIRECRKLAKQHQRLRNKAYAVIAWRGKEIAGWSLMFNDTEMYRTKWGWRPSWSSYTGTNWIAEFYVKRAYRNNGIASHLYDHVRAIRKSFYTYKHDDRARTFFTKNERRCKRK